jgi:uncharacterized damage-inducible protein DinB
VTVNDLEVLYEYDTWANHRVFEVVSQLTPEQFTQSVAGAYGSVRNTMVHILSAEWGWLDRSGGASHPSHPFHILGGHPKPTINRHLKTDN